ncbi:hypothetical protein BJ508DRAFT_306362 [Ascobolus immersus RN42]|uniref:Uncharacterized protein n=1 Tax=Ascobolus immersus RN42 TaxID=1160509 RepID=A0A3N4I8F7_ASCIM|nr:hypothetical protein BJ508DRAFT_306362 [Ascobolus immersus RN42]
MRFKSFIPRRSVLLRLFIATIIAAASLWTIDRAFSSRAGSGRPQLAPSWTGKQLLEPDSPSLSAPKDSPETPIEVPEHVNKTIPVLNFTRPSWEQVAAITRMLAAVTIDHPDIVQVAHIRSSGFYKYRPIAVNIITGLSCWMQWGKIGVGYPAVGTEHMEVIIDGLTKPSPCVDADVVGLGFLIPLTIILAFTALRVVLAVGFKDSRFGSQGVGYVTGAVLAGYVGAVLSQIHQDQLSFADTANSLVGMETICLLFLFSLGLRANLADPLYVYAIVIVVFFSRSVAFVVMARMDSFKGDTKAGCTIGLIWWGVFRHGSPTPLFCWIYYMCEWLRLVSALTSGKLLATTNLLYRGQLPATEENPAGNRNPLTSLWKGFIEIPGNLIIPRDAEAEVDKITAALRLNQAVTALPQFFLYFSGVGLVHVFSFCFAYGTLWHGCFTFGANALVFTFGHMLAIWSAIAGMLRDVSDLLAISGAVSNFAVRLGEIIAEHLMDGSVFGLVFDFPALAFIFALHYGFFFLRWVALGLVRMVKRCCGSE